MKAFLAGKKTYITAVIIALVVFAYQSGLIDKTLYECIFGLLTALGLGTLRAGLDNANDKMLGK